MSSTDIIPMHLLIQVFDAIGPCILSIINKSPSEGTFPKYYITVKPMLKKQNLDVTVLSNFRPIYFNSKVLEKVVSAQIQKMF